MKLKSTCLLTLALSVAAQASSGQSCDKVLKRAGVTAELDTPVLIVPDDEREGFVEGFFLRRLTNDTGQVIAPKSLSEANCFLDRMLSDGAKAAIRAGVRDFVERGSRGADPYLDPDPYIDNRLHELYPQIGMNGVNAIRAQMELQLGIQRFGIWDNWKRGDLNPLQQEAIRLRIYSPNNLLNWIFLNYLGSLRVTGFSPKSQLVYIRVREAPMNPPSILKVRGCPDKLNYEWPTTSALYDTPPEDETQSDIVHWAICKATDELWVYRYRSVWQKATDEQVKLFCLQYKDASPYKLERNGGIMNICARE